MGSAIRRMPYWPRAKSPVKLFVTAKTSERRESDATDIIQSGTPRANLSRVERREWGLWAAALIVILLLTAGLASFFLPGQQAQDDSYSGFALSQAMRGLVALVFLFA